MKVLIAGDWKYEIYEQALFDGFLNLGVNALKFSFSDYMKYPDVSVLKTLLFYRNEVELVNRKLEEYISLIKPDLVFFQRPIFVRSETLGNIRKGSTVKLISFHNDNPFNNIKNRVKNFSYINSLDSYDINYVFRPSNLNDVKKKTSKPAKLLMPYYVQGLHKKYGHLPKVIDVIFIGHYEKSRDKYCKNLISNNIDLKIYGPDWRNDNGLLKKNKNLFSAVNYKKYVHLLNESKIALAFLSRRNKDVYTRRNFEIPATGTFMLSERTPELQDIFIEGKECDYFSSEEELLDKVNYYLKNTSIREKIALAGYNKCVQTGNSNLDRAKEILQAYKKLL